MSLFGSGKTFAHGVHPPEHKDATEAKPIRRLPFPDEIIVPLSQHTGAPAKAIVRVGHEVVRGEPIAEPGGFVSVPMHAPATGVVRKIGPARDIRGGLSPAIFIHPHRSSVQEVLYGGSQDVDLLTPDDIVKAVQNTGVVGLGGAAFPTHVKLAIPKDKSADTVIVNGCECEPYLTTDHQVMVEQAPNIYMGLRIVMKALRAQRAIVGIEMNKPDAIEAMQKALPEGEPFTVQALDVKYPQGAEKMLVKSLLDRDVPTGGLPIDVGAVVFNVATLAQIGELLPRRRGLIERVVTVTGPAVEHPGNYLIPLGTPLRFVLEETGAKVDGRTEVIFGGPMMGAAVWSPEVPVTKGVTGIIVFGERELRKRNATIYPCIRCGQCVRACPMNLLPSLLGLLARREEYAVMEEKHNLADCFECGCCAYICPSNIPLVQYFRMAKSMNRERKAKA